MKQQQIRQPLKSSNLSKSQRFMLIMKKAYNKIWSQKQKGTKIYQRKSKDMKEEQYN